MKRQEFKTWSLIFVPVLFFLTTNPCTKKVVRIHSSLPNIKTNSPNELNSQFRYLNDGWISKNKWDKVKAKMVFYFLLVHRKWSFGKIQSFHFNRKGELVCHKPGNQHFPTFCNSKELFFIKNSQQKPTASKDKNGLQERNCLSLYPDIPQQNRLSPAPLRQRRASEHKTRSPRITESPPQFSLLPPKAARPHC